MFGTVYGEILRVPDKHWVEKKLILFLLIFNHVLQKKKSLDSATIIKLGHVGRIEKIMSYGIVVAIGIFYLYKERTQAMAS